MLSIPQPNSRRKAVMAQLPNYQDPAYTHGQILALQALFLGLANCTTDPQQLRHECGIRLETMRTALLSSGMPDTAIAGLDAMEQWLRMQTDV
jgi:hypothetical protein